ncbi:hypothetical protein [Desulfolucanica intricata]|uniref:hypothetical protein n=1 Tax=Desulfolucanica intricata TaxID=1285191 RepID=UPI00082B9A1D|nr:hypothetical protein [Desulfolucanica intricata]
MKMPYLYIYNKKGIVNVNRYCNLCSEKCSKVKLQESSLTEQQDLIEPSVQKSLPENLCVCKSSGNEPKQSSKQQLSYIHCLGNKVLQIVE